MFRIESTPPPASMGDKGEEGVGQEGGDDKEGYGSLPLKKRQKISSQEAREVTGAAFLLPRDMWVEIIGHLLLWDLAALSRVSKWFRDNTQGIREQIKSEVAKRHEKLWNELLAKRDKDFSDVNRQRTLDAEGRCAVQFRLIQNATLQNMLVLEALKYYTSLSFVDENSVFSLLAVALRLKNTRLVTALMNSVYEGLLDFLIYFWDPVQKRGVRIFQESKALGAQCGRFYDAQSQNIGSNIYLRLLLAEGQIETLIQILKREKSILNSPASSTIARAKNLIPVLLIQAALQKEEAFLLWFLSQKRVKENIAEYLLKMEQTLRAAKSIHERHESQEVLEFLFSGKCLQKLQDCVGQNFIRSVVSTARARGCAIPPIAESMPSIQTQSLPIAPKNPPVRPFGVGSASQGGAPREEPTFSQPLVVQAWKQNVLPPQADTVREQTGIVRTPDSEKGMLAWFSGTLKEERPEDASPSPKFR